MEESLPVARRKHVVDDVMRRLLDQVQTAAASEQRAEERLRAKVKNARRAGATWEDIAKAIGIAKQSAWQRFKSVEADLALELEGGEGDAAG